MTSWNLNGTTESYTYNATTGNLSIKGGLSLLYTDISHAHAVTSAGGNTYEYDANGNQKKRVIGGQTMALEYDTENRLVKVCQDTSNNGICDTSETVMASFTYDGDGKRVKSVMGSETILFIGAHYEIKNPGSGQEVTKYYFAGASRIAMRKYVIPQSMTVEYLLGDHLGSTSITTDSSGNKVSEMRYNPWGEIRASWTAGTSTTPAYKLLNYTFTGQYSDSYINLLWYGSRHYDPELGRFIQPDTIVPNIGKGVNVNLIVGYNETPFLDQLNEYNAKILAELSGQRKPLIRQINLDPQGFDRYSYTNNNPVKFTDSTGHCIWDLCILEIGVVSIGIIELAAAGGTVAFAAYIYGPEGDEHIESLTNGIISAGEQVSEITTLDLVVTAKKGDLQQVDDVGKKFGMTEQQRKAFGKFLEDAKANGEGGTANERGDFTWKELEEKAREFLEEAENN